LKETTVEIGLDDTEKLFDRVMEKVGGIVYNPEYKHDYYKYCVAKRAAMLRKVLENNAYYNGFEEVSFEEERLAVYRSKKGFVTEQKKQLRVISFIGQYMPRKPDVADEVKPLLDFYEKVNGLIDVVTEHLLSETRKSDINKQLRIAHILYEFREFPVVNPVETNILIGIVECILTLNIKYDRKKLEQIVLVRQQAAAQTRRDESQRRSGGA
jgi:hypothetical protein